MLAAQSGVGKKKNDKILKFFMKGGGGIYVPILIIIGGFDHQLSIALSKAIIFGGAITNFLFFAMRRHPKYPEVNRPLIDYDICMLIEPIVLAGTTIGVYLNVKKNHIKIEFNFHLFLDNVSLLVGCNSIIIIIRNYNL